MDTNLIHVTGVLISPIVYSHDYHNITFVKTTLATSRLSGVIDEIPLIIPESLIKLNPITKQSRVTLSGEIRSKDISNRTQVYVHAHELFESDLEDNNEFRIRGVVCKKPDYHQTSKGHDVAHILLAINREYNKSSYLNCITWNHYALVARGLQVGTTITCLGRFQSRTYSKNNTIDTTHELSVSSFIID